MTYQTAEPVRQIPMAVHGFSWGDLIHQVQRGEISYDVPYQRGSVWAYEQRILLIYSILSGTPIPALVVNERPREAWFDDAGNQLLSEAVIDGKQRIIAVRMFMEGELPVPATWFLSRYVLDTEDTDDGPYVRYPGLLRDAQRFFENEAVPVARSKVATVREEAEIYLRVNGGGTPQADEDMARAAGVATGGE